jgi:hypothetical protein
MLFVSVLFFFLHSTKKIIGLVLDDLFQKRSWLLQKLFAKANFFFETGWEGEEENPCSVGEENRSKIINNLKF